jgi:hypothetical protein
MSEINWSMHSDLPRQEDYPRYFPVSESGNSNLDGMLPTGRACPGLHNRSECNLECLRLLVSLFPWSPPTQASSRSHQVLTVSWAWTSVTSETLSPSMR